MSWALLILGALRKGAVALIDLVARYPLQCALAASLCFSGYVWLQWTDADAKLEDCRKARETDRKAYSKAQADALAKALAAKAAQEKRYRELAERTDHEHAESLADARAAADRFIARNRLPAPLGSAAERTPSPAESSNPGLPAGVPGDTDLVAVRGVDVQRCTAAVIYALEAHKWANSLAR
jgi:hypothetical protein